MRAVYIPGQSKASLVTVGNISIRDLELWPFALIFWIVEPCLGWTVGSIQGVHWGPY